MARVEQVGARLQEADNEPSVGAGFKGAEASRFLDLLGKDRATAWMRAIKPDRRGAVEHQGIATREDRAWIDSKTADGFNLYAVIGEASSATGKGGGVQDTDITGCPALFVEWDDGATIDEQVQRWQSLDLPEPSVMVATGGKSVHCYWALLEPISATEWKRITARLITHCSSDKSCSNPSRVMRLPGSIYYDKKTGEVSGQCRIISAAGHRYAAFDIDAALPTPPPAKPATAAPKGQWEPRGIDEINAAAEYIPERVVGGDTYRESMHALCGCSAALEEAGVSDPDAAALALLGHLWPSEAEARQVLDSTTTRKARSFWAIAGQHGYSLKRTTKPKTVTSRHQQAKQADDEPPTYSKLMEAILTGTVEGDDDKVMALKAEAISRFRRTDAQVEAALFKLHAKQQTSTGQKQAPESLDLSSITGMDWLVEGFVPDNDQTLLWGDAGTGKTTAALAIAHAALKGTGVLDHDAPTSVSGVLFIASDSGAAPLYAAMQDAGMADLPEVMEGPRKRFHAWAADAGQGMGAWCANLRGCIQLLEFVRRHRIRLVIIDSCKTACSGADLDYTNNQLVSSLLTYFKEVICPHAAVVWLNHDGVAKGAHAGAKAWKEVPSMVHRIIREENKDGTFINSRRIWRVTKSRMGPTREFFYELNQGQLKLCPNQEKVGNCLDRVVEVLAGAWQMQGHASLTKADLVERICMTGGPSKKTLDNTLSAATRAKHPQVCRVASKRGHYKLAPRLLDSLKGHTLNGKEHGENLVVDSVLTSSRQVPEGKTPRDPNQRNGSQRSPGNKAPDLYPGELPDDFPREKDGNLSGTSDGLGSGQVPSRFTCASYREGELLPLPDPMRKANEARIRESGHDPDMANWSDEEVADMRMALEQAATRRAAAGLMAMAEVA